MLVGDGVLCWLVTVCCVGCWWWFVVLCLWYDGVLGWWVTVCCVVLVVVGVLCMWYDGVFMVCCIGGS